jgi:hypothetical protein
MSTLVLHKTGNRVRIGPAGDVTQPQRIHSLASFVDLAPEANAVAASFSRRVKDRYWRLEYAKLVAAEGFAVLGQAGEIAGVAGADETPVLLEDIVESDRVCVAAVRALSDAGHTVDGAGRASLFLRLRYRLSVGVAMAAWLLTLIRHGWGNKLPPEASGGLIIAVHGEVSNRTGHVLAAAAKSGSVAAAIVLGRPKSALRDISREWASKFGLVDVRACRPISLTAAFKSMPEMIRQVQAGAAILGDTGYSAPWSDEIAVLYRMCLGTCSRAWWREQTPSTAVVVYGHTGLADTSMLEAEQQAGGARTVHWAHGISGGWNFAGYSDLGLFRCGYDAIVHRGLPGYGKTASIDLPKPVRSGREGTQWLLLTNYAHPTNPFSGHGAIDLEIATVRLAADAAKRSGVDVGDLLWRPHPMFWSMPSEIIKRVMADTAATGIRMPRPNDPVPMFKTFRTVLCTPSTAALEVLREGILPVIVAPHRLPEGSAYSAFPLHVADAETLVRAIAEIDDAEAENRLYDEAWRRIAPGAGAVSMGDIFDLLDG